MQTIQNGSDLVLLYQPLSLYLKPSANLQISLTLPSNVTGKTISNFEVMDKLRQMILPDSFSLLKVSSNLYKIIHISNYWIFLGVKNYNRLFTLRRRTG